VWFSRLFFLVLVWGLYDFLAQWQGSAGSTTKQGSLGLWDRSARRSHDDYDNRAEENREYMDKAKEDFASPRRLFYIYDWNSSIVNRWPDKDSHHRLSIPAVYRANDGIGPVVDAAQGRYMTHQYSLFRTFHARLRESPLRTLDPSKASLFFIPYDLGMDSSTRQSDGALVRTNCPKKAEVVSLLGASPWFERLRGADHFILHTINQMMVHYSNFDGCMDLYDFCFNCTKLGIDAYGPELYVEIARRPYMQRRWVSVPFPSDFHASALATQPLWRATTASVKRPVLLAFVGSDQVTANKQKTLRRAIIDACRKMSDPQACVIVELETHESHAMLSSSSSSSSSAPNNIYARSRLCLMPGGDFPTRKGFFDALLSGCVPVIFQPASALTQWPWHWAAAGGKGQAEACTVYMPWKAFLEKPQKSLDDLVEIAQDDALLASKRACIARVAPVMQYRVPGHKGPQDAVDVALSRLLTQSSQ